MIEQAEKIKEKKYSKIYSFDIFDTLLTRTFASPDAIFLILQEKLKSFSNFSSLPDSLKNNFYTIRKEAQLFCTSNQYILNKKQDCNLDNIYEVIKNNYDLNENETNLIKNLEIETEFENILPVEENINKVIKLVNEGEKVILISDMYLSAEIVRNFLTKFDEIFKDVEIYTSGDIGKLKSDGSLFNFIKEKYPNVKWEHFGDNKISDYFVPKFNGISANRYYPEKLKPYEKMLLEDKTSVYKNLSVGISRYVRGFNKQSKSFELGCSFAGPMLLGYVEWVLEQSVKRGIKNIYFVARDGYVLREIANIIIEQRNIDIKTHYFYSSRIANRIPDENNIDDFINNFRDELPSLMSVEFVSKRLNITVEDFKKFINLKNTNKHLSPSETSELVGKMLADDEFKKFVIEKNKPRKDLFLRYIKQEIDLSKNNFAFVELNGTGRTQDNIASLIYAESNQKPIKSFFLISLPDMRQNEFSKKYFYSYPEELDGFIEVFCRTIHGQTIGYEEREGKILPILEVKKYKQMEKWGYKEYIDGLKLYTKLFCKYLDVNAVKSSDIDLFAKYYDYFKYNLDEDTADIIRKIPFFIYGDETKTKESLPTYSLFNVLTDKAILKDFLARKFHQTLKRMALLGLILSNKFKKNNKTIYELYYRYFLK